MSTPQPPGPPVQPVQPVQLPPTSGQGIAGMVLGIVSLVIPCVGFVTAPTGVGLSIAGYRECHAHPGTRGEGMAIAGIVMNAVACFGYYGWLFLLLTGLVTPPA